MSTIAEFGRGHSSLSGLYLSLWRKLWNQFGNAGIAFQSPGVVSCPFAGPSAALCVNDGAAQMALQTSRAVAGFHRIDDRGLQGERGGRPGASNLESSSARSGSKGDGMAAVDTLLKMQHLPHSDISVTGSTIIVLC